MSANSSSSVHLYNLLQTCIKSRAGGSCFTTFTVISMVLFLPLYVQVIYLVHQRWPRLAPMSHSDLFTYHLVIIELMNVVGSILCICGIYTDLSETIMLGLHLFFINTCGQQLFHVLTCVERYLAVVHPIIYLGLRKGKGITIRNIAIGYVWLMSFANSGFLYLGDNAAFDILSHILLICVFVVISFCSISVLFVLIRPGPGDGGGDRRRVDQSKLRAFFTIMAILGVLLLKIGGTEIAIVLFSSHQLVENEKCIAWISSMWFCLPSSLVLPLLFLHRAGKLLGCWSNNESGQGSD